MIHKGGRETLAMCWIEGILGSKHEVGRKKTEWCCQSRVSEGWHLKTDLNSQYCAEVAMIEYKCRVCENCAPSMPLVDRSGTSIPALAGTDS
jgi:hypothetical protein